jgi:hypothetical protein
MQNALLKQALLKGEVRRKKGAISPRKKRKLLLLSFRILSETMKEFHLDFLFDTTRIYWWQN